MFRLIGRGVAAGVLATLIIVCGSRPIFGQDSEEGEGWGFEGEISGVWVGGNSVSRTIGLDGTASYHWPKSVFSIQGGGLRTETTLRTKFAIGTEEDFEITEVDANVTASEAYQARTWYDYRFSKKSFFVVGVDWLRNTFSGIDSRFLVGVGAGNAWVDTKTLNFETSYGLTYTFESDVVQDPFNKSQFPGLRLSYRIEANLTETTKLASRFAGDWNLQNTDDLRFDWTNSVSVSIISILALKPSLKLLWRNDPALTEVPLIGDDGPGSGKKVVVPLQKLDSFLTLALVVTL
jgi:hypothetical protein